MLAVQSKLFAQSAQSSIPDFKYKILFKISSGYPGILYLDELTQPARFEREAFPPLAAQIDYAIFPRISASLYFGYEYEKVSGTLTNFPGPTKSLVTGVGLAYHLIRNYNLNWFDPYAGLTFYYYDTNYIPKGFSPAFRIGANFFIYKNLGANLNVGVGAALVEAGLIYGITF